MQVVFSLFILCNFANAQLVQDSGNSIKASSNPSQTHGKIAQAKPTWEQLTAAQQKALAPLQADWSGLDAVRKQKWLGIAQRYQAMSVEDQQRMHTRMQAWAQLTTAQRQQARDNYIKTLVAPRTEKGDQMTHKPDLNEKWVKYQALPPEKRAALQAEAEKNARPSTEGLPNQAKSKPLAAPVPVSPKSVP